MIPFIVAALAEPPMPVSVPDAVAASELVVIATPDRVYFEALAPGGSLQTHSHADYWVEYQVSSVLFGSSPVPLDQPLRIMFDPGACERYEFSIHREGDRYVEKYIGRGASVGSGRPLDPAQWTGGGPQVLLLDVLPDGTVRNDAFGASPAPATRDHVAEVSRLLEKKGKR